MVIAMLDKVKLAMAVSSTDFDADIQGLIDACLRDLNISGVDTNAANDPLIARAVIFYCKAYFRNDDKSERYQKAYENLKTALSLSGDYKCRV